MEFPTCSQNASAHNYYDFYAKTLQLQITVGKGLFYLGFQLLTLRAGSSLSV